MHSSVALSLVPVLLALAACGNAPPAPAAPLATTPAASEEPPVTGSLAAREAASEPDATVEYDCEGLRINVATDADGDRVRFVVDGDTLELAREAGPSGRLYVAAEGHRFWAHRDDEARLTLPGQHERNCHRVY